MRKSFITTIAVALILAPLAFAAPVQAATRWVVDDDKQQCKNADFTSIQAAINAASSGDTIQVCAGTYNETLTINKSLHLVGRGNTTNNCDGQVAIASPVKQTILTSQGTYTVNIQADNVHLEGFVIQGNGSGPGIYTSPAFSGYHIEDNLIQDNVFGLYLNSSGAIPSNVHDNCFKANNRSGSAAGNGIYSDQGLSNAAIIDNDFTGHNNASMVFAGPAGSQTNIRIEDNELRRDSAIVLFNLTNSWVVDNKIYNSITHGIQAGGNVSSVTITDNRVDRAAWSGIRVSGGNNTNLTIQDNRLTNNGDHGIRVTDGDNNNIEGNRIENNNLDGISLDVDSSGNQVTNNRMRGNREHDCHDDSIGSGTAGTANTWSNNRGMTENRAGLCRGARVPTQPQS
jgi:parallel beta-helix repeat protein